MNADTLGYPMSPPLAGGWKEVVAGVRWLRLPLPYGSDHINVWSLDDGDGWALVDTGTCSDLLVTEWERLLARAPHDRPLTQVIVTHMHLDHMGMAGWLTRKYDAPLWMSSLEYLYCRTLIADTERGAPADALRFFTEAGWSAASIDKYRVFYGALGKLIYTPPDSYHRLRDGDFVHIGEHCWEVVTGSGHSPEHSCLYCADLELLISGDQVLPEISSNVSVHPLEPCANPMADWLASLDKLQARIPDDVLVLPAHDDCFRGLHARIAQLRESQHRALDRLREAVSTPSRVVDLFRALFSRTIKPDTEDFYLATGEALACLNYLIQRGEVVRELREGVAWYCHA